MTLAAIDTDLNRIAEMLEQSSDVLVISGALILTADGGAPQKFEAGESVLVPKGFTGTWEMQGEFRELVVMMREQK